MIVPVVQKRALTILTMFGLSLVGAVCVMLVPAGSHAAATRLTFAQALTALQGRHSDQSVHVLAVQLPPALTASPPSPFPPPLPGPDHMWRPVPGTSWHIQFTGTLDTSVNVEMYDIDLFDTSLDTIAQLHTANRIAVCYFSAGSWEDWRPDSQQFPASVTGRSNGWPGEKWLDIRQLDVLAPIMDARLDLAVKKGCDGIEPDNIDGYINNTGFPLSAEDQLRYNIWLANTAHARGLSIGLKNDLQQVAPLEPYFDWALNEQCLHYKECAYLLPFIEAGKAVFGIEYGSDPTQFCPQANTLNFDTQKKAMALNAWRVACR